MKVPPGMHAMPGRGLARAHIFVGEAVRQTVPTIAARTTKRLADKRSDRCIPRSFRARFHIDGLDGGLLRLGALARLLAGTASAERLSDRAAEPMGSPCWAACSRAA